MGRPLKLGAGVYGLTAAEHRAVARGYEQAAEWWASRNCPENAAHWHEQARIRLNLLKPQPAEPPHA